MIFKAIGWGLSGLKKGAAKGSGFMGKGLLGVLGAGVGAGAGFAASLTSMAMMLVGAVAIAAVAYGAYKLVSYAMSDDDEKATQHAMQQNPNLARGLSPAMQPAIANVPTFPQMPRPVNYGGMIGGVNYVNSAHPAAVTAMPNQAMYQQAAPGGTGSQWANYVGGSRKQGGGFVDAVNNPTVAQDMDFSRPN